LDIHKNITIKAKMQQEISKIIKKVEQEQIWDLEYMINSENNLQNSC
jgi:hypothetical protein